MLLCIYIYIWWLYNEKNVLNMCSYCKVNEIKWTKCSLCKTMGVEEILNGSRISVFGYNKY